MAEENTASNPTGDNASSWSYADNVAGAGDRPDYLKSKFNSVEAQAKSYAELESRFGGFTGSPENYDFGEGVNAKDPRISGLVDIARDANMNNDVLNKIISLDAGSKKAYQDEQLKLLGDNASQRLSALDDWSKNNVPADMQDSFKSIATNAKAVEFLEHIMNASKPQGMADGTAPQNTGVTKDDLDAMQFAEDDHGNRLISVNPAKRAEFEEAYKKFLGQS